MNWSKSLTVVVARNIFSPFRFEARRSRAQSRVAVRTNGLGEHALLGLDDAEVLNDVEAAVVGARDVHVQPKVVLAGHHLGGATGTVSNPRVIQGADDVVLVHRSGLVDG